MERIDSLGEPSQRLIPEKKKTGRKEKAQRRAFSDLVEAADKGEQAAAEDLADDAARQGIEDLLDGVFASGEKLKKTPTMASIREYRQKVREFVKHVVNHMLALEETTSGANVLRRKRFTLVRVIDEKLEALAVSVLSSQKEQMSILAQVDQINGLIVDLVS